MTRLLRVVTTFHSGRLLAGLLFTAIFSLAAVPPLDPDLWWHLANGRLLSFPVSFPHTDLYSFTATGHVWVMHEWLSDLMMYGLFTLGGLPLLVVVFAAIVTAGGVVLYLLLRRAGLHPTASVALTLMGILAGSTAWGARPQVLNVLFTAALVLGLQGYHTGRLRAWWLTPFLWLWANLHSAFLVGVIITALFLFGEMIDSWRTGAAPVPPRLRALALALLAGIGLSVINPYGIETLLFPLGTLTSPLIQNNIQEWASPDFHTLPGQLLEALIFIVILGLATGRVRARTSEWLWALALLYLALSSQRQVPLFVLAAAPLIGRCGQAVIGWLGDLHDLRAPSLTVPQAGSDMRERVAFRWSPPSFGGTRSSPVLGFVNLAILLVVGAGMIAYRAFPSVEPAHQAAAIAATFPVKTTDAVQRLGLGSSLRVFNYYDYGGYLLWRLYPSGGRVFIDGRVEVYGPQVFRDYLSINYSSNDWRTLLVRYDPNVILLPKGHPLVDVLRRDQSWHELAEDSVSVAFRATDMAQ